MVKITFIDDVSNISKPTLQEFTEDQIKMMTKRFLDVKGLIISRPVEEKDLKDLKEKLDSSRFELTNDPASQEGKCDGQCAVLEKALELVLKERCHDCQNQFVNGTGCKGCKYKKEEGYFIKLAKNLIDQENKKKQQQDQEQKQFEEKVNQITLEIQDLFLDKKSAEVVAEKLVKRGWVKQPTKNKTKIKISD